jgi:MFS family permease
MPGTGGKAGPVVPLQTAPPPSARAPSKANRRRVHILLLVVALDLSAVALAAPLIPGKMRELGVLAETVYAGSQVVGSVMLGALSDRISRSHVLLLSFSATVASYALAGLGGSVWALLAGR